ncbi:DNA ligase (ATP) [Allomyces javanicus]|nr:DNA ligase (ATP) [Allomyces javanicus]
MAYPAHTARAAAAAAAQQPLRWNEFTDVLEEAQTSRQDRKHLLLRGLLERVHARHNPNEASAVLRLLLPAHDRARGVYKLKEAALAKCIKDALHLPEASDDARALKNWRAPRAGHAGAGSHGDFAAVAYDVLAPRMPTAVAGGGSVLVTDVDAKLDALAAAAATGDVCAKDLVVQWALSVMTPKEIKWWLRVVLKDLKLGMSERTVLKEWHPSAMQLFTTSSDLHAVATRLIDRATTLTAHDAALQVMVPFRPMLGFKADRLNLLPEKLARFQSPFWCQEKVDGERLMIHYKDGEYKFYTRNAVDWTSDFMKSWVRHVGPFFDPGVQEFILDGEMVAVEMRTQEVLPFGTLRAAQQSDAIDAGTLATHPRYYCFDLLFAQGGSLQHRALVDRYLALRQFFHPRVGWFEILPVVECTTPNDVLVRLKAIYESKGEGLVVKDPASMYLPGERPGCWLKVKTDYSDELAEPMDLAIMGASWGEGKRGNRFSHFLLGLRNSGAGRNGEDTWVSFARVGSGYTIQQLDDLHAAICDEYPNLAKGSAAVAPGTSALTVPSNLPPPPWAEVMGNAKERPDVYIFPVRGMVLEVIAAELAAAEDFKAGATLRFPRVRRIRKDKDPAEAMSLDDMNDMWTKTQGRLVRAPTAEIFTAKTGAGKGAGKKGVKRTKDRTILSAFHRFDRDVSAKPLFDGMTFLVCARDGNKDDPLSAEALCELVQKFGGKVMAAVPSEPKKRGKAAAASAAEPDQTQRLDFVLVTDPDSYTASSLRKRAKYDMIHADHLLDCVAAKQWTPPPPDAYLFMTPTTQARLRAEFDEWGDHYTVPIANDKQFARLLEYMDRAPSAAAAAAVADDDDDDLPPRFAMSFAGIDLDTPWLARYDANVMGREPAIRADRAKKVAQLEGFRARYFNSTGFPGRWFDGMRVYPHMYAVVGDVTTRARGVPSSKLAVAIARLTMYGAEVASDVLTPAASRAVTHVLLEDRASKLPELQGFKHVITPEWVARCCEEQTRLPEM